MNNISNIILNIFLITFSFLISNQLIKLFIRKFSNNFLDLPNSRSLHKKPIPRGAGIIFVLMTLISCLINIFINGASYTYLIPVISIPLVIIGVLDDILSVSSKIKYLVHILTATIIFFNSKLLLFNGLKNNINIILFFIFIIFAITAFINFINFMDGIDGLVGLTMIISILTCLIKLNLGQPYLVLLFSLFSFVKWNWHPAKVFMGDTGSTFLAATNIGLISLSKNYLEAISLLLILSPCLVDACSCVIRRFYWNQNIFEAHRLHLYQRLALNGMNPRKISLLYVSGSLTIAISVLYFNVISTLIFVMLITFFGYYLDQNFSLKFKDAINIKSQKI